MKTTVVGSGCFWCTEAFYRRKRGVIDVRCGYSGGHKENPSYEEVCSGTTGHIEVCVITFDESVTSFSEIFELFFKIHDPTSQDQQGSDVGTQYRSVIFYEDPEEKSAAEESLKTAQKNYSNALIVTQILLRKLPVYPAEDYHQNYFAANEKKNLYCARVIRPKLAAHGFLDSNSA